MTNLIGAAYKWRINNNVYSYITNAEGGDPFISSGSTVCNEELIRSKVQNFTEGEYKTKFDEMVNIVHEKYPYVQFLDYTIYMNEVEHCDIYNRPDVVTDIDIAVCSTTLPSDSGATVEITSTDEDDIECRDGEKIRKYRIYFGIPKGSSLIPIDVTDEELSENGDQIIKDYGILAGDSVISVDSTTIWRCDENNNFINTGVKLNKSAYRYFKDINAYSFGENDTANGVNSITEGHGTETFGEASHAEGYKNESRGDYSHAEGCENIAKGVGSHAEGYKNESRGDYSHAEGCENIAINAYSTVIGKYADIDGTGKKIFQVGWAEDEEHRRDFFAVNNDGTFIFSNSGETKTLSLSDFGRETVKFQDSLVLDPKYGYKNGDLIFNEDETDKNLYLLKSIEEDEDKKEDGLYLSISKDEDNLTFEAINLTKNDEIEKLNGDIAGLNENIAVLNENIADLNEQIKDVTATPQFMVGTVVMWPSYEVPSGWLPCNNTPIPNKDGEGEELIKILYPDYKEGDDGVYRTPNYCDLYTKNDTYSDLFLNFIIYAGANVNSCVDEPINFTIDNKDIGKYYTRPLGENTTLFQAGQTIKDKFKYEEPIFGIWTWDTNTLLFSAKTTNTYNIEFTLDKDNEYIEAGQPLGCGFMFTDINLRDPDYCVQIIPSDDNYIGKNLTMTVEINTTKLSFTINSFVKQICN